MKKGQSLIITGMHRSHTSLVTEGVQEAGLFIGKDLIPPASSNARGHFESKAVVAFHEKVIKENNLSSWTTLIDGNKARKISASMDFQKSAKALIKRHFDVPFFGWKDPRGAFFLEGWDEVLPHSFYIFCIRHPSSCVQSLNRRSLQNRLIKFRPFLTYRHFNLWYQTNLSIFQFIQKHPARCLVLHLPDDLESNIKIKRMNELIQKNWGLELKDISFENIYDKSLVTSRTVSPYVNAVYQRSSKVKSLYRSLLDLS